MPNMSYHPKELGFNDPRPSTAASGLLGVLYLFACVGMAFVIFLVATPFILLGVAEIVTDSPTHYRVRWVRHD